MNTNAEGTQPLIRPLWEAENHFLEALVDRFHLKRKPSGLGWEMEVAFDSKSPSIWHRDGKQEIRSRLMPDYAQQWQRHQSTLDEVFSTAGPKDWTYDDAEFPFRFCSGGALPVVRRAGVDYYRLHWRDIHPVGWNITNGGSDSIAEMLKPESIIEREFQEELLIYDLDEHAPRRLLLGSRDRPVHEGPAGLAVRLWESKFKTDGHKMDQITSVELPVGWLKGPDDMVITFRDHRRSQKQSHRARGVFLNINAEDFGIEIDRVAHIEIPETAIICDGETIEGLLLDSPIGLFEVSKFDAALREGSTHFVPDILFHGGCELPASSLDEAVEDFLTHKKNSGLFSSGTALRPDGSSPNWFGLCPVTRRLIQRLAPMRAARPTQAAKYDVFLSFAGEDEAQARQVCDFLTSQGKTVFFAPETLREADFTFAVFDALHHSSTLLAVATRYDHLLKKWPHFEAKTYLSQVVQGSGEMYSLLINWSPASRPPSPLEHYHYWKCSESEMEAKLTDLMRRVTKKQPEGA
jgi:hypothetical protein